MQQEQPQGYQQARAKLTAAQQVLRRQLAVRHQRRFLGRQRVLFLPACELVSV